jgi:hypothetical protein
MQLTIEVPEHLGQKLESDPGHVAEALEMGLRLRQWAAGSPLAQEVIGFLARGPRPEEIVSFRPSEQALERSRELLDRNKAGSLTPAEEAELDEMALLDHLVALIKAKAWQHVQAAA